MDLENIRSEFAKKSKKGRLPKNIELNIKNKLGLISKPIRTISGVAPVAIMTRPEMCPHGTCTFCCGGPRSFFGDVPKSYTGNEPASMRAIRNKFDAYLQVFNRLEHYVLLNQIPEKVELIIMGGTFLAYDEEYQDEFVTEAFRAMNDFGDMFFKNNELNYEKFKDFFELDMDFKSDERKEKIHSKIFALKKKSNLEKEQERNETSKIRCVTFNVETKPDWCFEKHINQALKLGVTRIEIGIQTLNDDILEKTHRGHTVEDTIKATKLLKDSFIKTLFHCMPGLPGSNKQEDIENFKKIFEDGNFKPDGLKIYPCMVMPGTALEKQYKKGLFKPLTTEEAMEIVVAGKKFIPRYCRVLRIQRDIPTKVTVDGVNITNFRQYVHQIMDKKGEKCNCIRCREPMKKEIDWNNVKMNRIDYDASDGKEIFLSFDDMTNDILLGFLRLRIPGKSFRKEIDENSAGVREIHVYGKAAKIGEEGEVQHRGLGKKLLEEAERITQEEFGKSKMLIISGIGVRKYFEKFGYKKEGPYVSKKL